MLKSALGVVISLLAVAITVPSAYGTTTAKTPVKKQVAKKPAGKKQTAKKAVAKTNLRSTRRATQVASKTPSHKRKASVQRVSFAPSAAAAATAIAPPVLSAGELAGLHLTHDALALKSNAAFVVEQDSSQVLFEKNAGIALPIASLTKLMTALVVVEARQDMNEVLEVTSDDIDREKNSGSRLRVGSRMSRADMLHIALMSSENRAASALGRHYPGGLPAFVAAMNAKAKALGMSSARFADSTGLSSQNVATARDLAKLVVAAYRHPIIREYSTNASYAVKAGNYQLQYINSNRLVKNPSWDIGLQKTGYISEAGRCLVMQSRIDGRPVVMVFLDSKGKDTRLGDAARVRKWLETAKPHIPMQAAAQQS